MEMSQREMVLQEGYEETDLICRTRARQDVIDVIRRVPYEIPEFLALMRAGKINGHYYTKCDGNKCVCLLGTLAQLASGRSITENDLDGYLIDATIRERDVSSPAEEWFYAIEEGETPEDNPFARDAYRWISDWYDEHVGSDRVAHRGRELVGASR